MLLSILKSELSAKSQTALDLDSKPSIRLIKALERALVRKQGISIPYWSEQVGNELVELFSFVLPQYELATTDIRNKYASLVPNYAKIASIYGAQECRDYCYQTKIADYIPRRNDGEVASDLVKTPSGVKTAGLVRKGFALASQQNYRYDTAMLAKYYNAIVLNTTKGIRKVATKYPALLEDDTSYMEISEGVLQDILANDGLYNLEGNVSDQRGRSIYNGLKRVFNPIGYKDARALLIVDKPIIITATATPALDDIYLFIAELLGLKRQRQVQRRMAGYLAYQKRTLPQLDLSLEDERKDLHELIWLERIYALLDTMNANGSVVWNVPIEKDASMSLAQIVGCLTSDKRLLDKTNVIDRNNLQDPWHIDGVRRLSAKTQVAVFYGSSATTSKLLKDNGIDIQQAEVKAINREFNRGAFSVIKSLKNALIKTSNVTTPTYEVTTWGETFTVEVNKFRTVGSTLNAYSVWDSKKNRTKVFFMHAPIRVPDYERYRLYMATGLIHNLDGIIGDRVTQQAIEGGEWCISIHDAWLVLPGSRVPALYTNQLNRLHADRASIISNYRRSIGAVDKKADLAFVQMLELVDPLEGPLEAEQSCLK